MRFNNNKVDIYKICSKNGYNASVEKSFYPLGENNPDEVWLEDKLSRSAVINDFDNNGKEEIGIRLFNTNITLDQAEKLIKELQDGIKFGNYLKENL